MQSEPVWITRENVVEIIGASFRKPASRICSSAALCSRTRSATPEICSLYSQEADLADVATALMLGIARYHCFLQGNKRAGFVSAPLFLDFNGHVIEAPDTAEWADMIIRTLTDRSLDPELARSLRLHCRPILP